MTTLNKHYVSNEQAGSRELEIRDLRAVAFVVDTFENPYAGTEGQLLSLIRGLQEAGIDCTLIVLHRSAYIESGQMPCPVKVMTKVRLGKVSTWLACWRLGRVLARQGVQVAQTFMIDASILFPPTFRLAGIKTFISRRDLGYWYTLKYRLVLGLVKSTAAGYVCNSQAVAERAQQVEGVPPERCHVIYNALCGQNGGHDVGELEELRAEGKKIIGLVANIRPIKRIHDLLDAMSVLSELFPETEAVIVGAGESEPLLERARMAGIEDRVHFLGARSDVDACLQYFDVGVLCSQSEGFSNTLLEYMRAGIPSVCSAVGGNSEAIDHGQTGFLYPVGDVVALTDALRHLLADDGKRAEIGSRAKEVALERYSAERSVAGHLAIYRRAIGHK